MDAYQPLVVQTSQSQHPLPRQLDLPCGLSLFPASFRNTNGTSVSQLHLILDGLERAGAVMREVNAGEGAGAEIIRTMGYNERSRLAKLNPTQFEGWKIPDSYVR